THAAPLDLPESAPDPFPGGFPSDPDDPAVEIVRSAKRKRTVSASVRDGRVVVRVPAGLRQAEERKHVLKMLSSLARKHGTSNTRNSDAYLRRRARELAEKWLDTPGSMPVIDDLASITWVAPMSTRWASCTPRTGRIRVSSSLQRAPGYVLDYILVHELAHLRSPGHDSTFWRRVGRYPHTERAHGFLQAWSLFGNDAGRAAPDMTAAEPDYGWDEGPGEG
ncbi:M48 metallopeptidase family protein, partial [Dietzia sp.]|uniref:M48 metallopeptidase family protein n=1 Tax=Dietzia sp. TaxID=1871616 RepID=UPI002FDAE268